MHIAMHALEQRVVFDQPSLIFIRAKAVLVENCGLMDLDRM